MALGQGLLWYGHGIGIPGVGYGGKRATARPIRRQADASLPGDNKSQENAIPGISSCWVSGSMISLAGRTGSCRSDHVLVQTTSDGVQRPGKRHASYEHIMDIVAPCLYRLALCSGAIPSCFEEMP
jgi:hypothetical protein